MEMSQPRVKLMAINWFALARPSPEVKTIGLGNEVPIGAEKILS